MKLTDKHFKLFQKECLHYLDKFHLNDYEVLFEFKELNNDAESAIQSDGNITLGLDTDIDSFNENINDYIKDLAKHEVVHCLLNRFSSIARRRYINKKELDIEEEHLVRKLCKLIE